MFVNLKMHQLLSIVMIIPVMDVAIVIIGTWFLKTELRVFKHLVLRLNIARNMIRQHVVVYYVLPEEDVILLQMVLPASDLFFIVKIRKIMFAKHVK